MIRLLRWVTELPYRAYWRLTNRGYTCDDCKSWTPRGRGKAYVCVEYIEHAVVPLPPEPRICYIPERDDRWLDAAEIVLALERRSTSQRVVLRCPACAGRLLDGGGRRG